MREDLGVGSTLGKLRLKGNIGFLSTSFRDTRKINSLYKAKNMHISFTLDQTQGSNARKVNCGRVYSAYTLKPVLFGLNL